jgi:hypothetical protein
MKEIRDNSAADDENKTSIGLILTGSVSSMKALLRTMLVCLFVSQLTFVCLAQVGIITTYVGPGLCGSNSSSLTFFGTRFSDG